MRKFLPYVVVLALVFTVTAHAQSPPTPGSSTASTSMLSGIDAMTSTVMQEKQSSFSGLGFRLRLQPERLVKQIEIMPYMEYWRNSNSLSTYDIETSRKDATLGVDGRYKFSATGWTPYVGMGWGLHFLTNKVDAPTLGLNNASDSVVKGGLSALAGVSFAITDKIDNFIDLKYHHVTDYRQLKINWGIGYNL